MGNKVFYIQASSQNEQKLSIKETATYLIDLLTLLSKEDDIFEEFVFSRTRIKEKINIKQMGRENAIITLSELFIKAYKGNIKTSHIPLNTIATIDFSWSRGFLFLLNFHKEGKQRFSMTGCIGGDYREVRLEYFYSKYTYSFKWFYNMLKFLVENINAELGVIGIAGLPEYFKIIFELKPKFNFGWVNYFSNDFPLDIPNDLEGMEYIFTEKGKYLLISREGFEEDLTSNGLYTDKVDKIIAIMRELKERVPNYCQD